MQKIIYLNFYFSLIGSLLCVVEREISYKEGITTGKKELRIILLTVSMVFTVFLLIGIFFRYLTEIEL